MGDDTIRGLGTGELVRRLINNISNLLNHEVELAKQEVRQDAQKAVVGAGLLGLGALLLYSFLAALIVAAVLAIGPGLTPVIGALAAAAVFLVLGAIVALIGWRTARIQPLVRTRETVREDIEWARRQVK